MEKIISDQYTLYIYNPINEDDKLYIKNNKDLIYNFLQEGYKYVGLNSFKSCINAKSLAKNCVLLKVAYTNNELVAVAIYSSRNCGYKRVGVAATTNNIYRKIGVQAVKDIIKYDAKSYDKFYWTVCSDSIYHLCKKYNAIPIPNEYAIYIDNRLIPDEHDEYKVYIDLHDDNPPHEKWIFGFNSPELYNRIIEKNDQRVLSYIDKINQGMNPSKLNENNGLLYDKYEASHRIINVIYDERCEVTTDMSTKIKSILIQNMHILLNFCKKYPADINVHKFKVDISNALDLIKWSNIVKLYELH